MRKKIQSLSEISKAISKLKARGKKVVQCHGVFDLVHPGHIRHLQSAKKGNDVLVVTLTKDKYVKRGPGRPIFNEQLRAESLAALEITDFVCAVDSPTAVEAIRAIRPNYYAKGQDYRDRRQDVTGKIHDEEHVLKSVGGSILFTDDITFSSSSLINQHLEVYSPHTVSYFKTLSSRYSIDDIIDKVNAVQKLRVLVIGDAIIDQYHYCHPMGKSSKEPIVVNKYVSEESFTGGSLATANHVAELSNKTQLLSVLGKTKSFEGFIDKQLNKAIRSKFFYRKNGTTIIKRRFVSRETNQKFFEICYMNDTLLNAREEDGVNEYLKKHLKKYDLVMVNDFGHGMITPKIIHTICSKSKCLALNVQTNSANLGFNMVTKYKRADYVCIDEVELRLATHDRLSDLRHLVKKIYKSLQCQRITVTRGKDGSLSYSGKDGFQEAPALSYQVVDKVGAGDAYFAYSSPCFALGLSQDLVSFIGNAAGSLAVQIVGNREPVKKVDLIKFITRLLKY